ncbi:hypothetical protein AB6F89_22385 [Providencia hangzhouensis]|uniref:hypothetical protein n=2 Tax=Providencia hangzhouensis TaxID=3031799 RepID=UPI0034DCCCF8
MHLICDDLRVEYMTAKRMAKKQQMQWSQEGAHYLLQTRVAVLNGLVANNKFACFSLSAKPVF